MFHGNVSRINFSYAFYKFPLWETSTVLATRTGAHTQACGRGCVHTDTDERTGSINKIDGKYQLTLTVNLRILLNSDFSCLFLIFSIKSYSY